MSFTSAVSPARLSVLLQTSRDSCGCLTLTRCWRCGSQGPGVLGEQGWFGGSQDSGTAADQLLDAFAMAPTAEGPALGPLASDPGMDWVTDLLCRRPLASLVLPL